MDRRVESYLQRAREALREGDADEAFAFEREAAGEVERLGDPPDEKAALLEQRAARLLAGKEVSRARSILEEVLELRRGRYDLLGEFAALHQLGLAEQVVGRQEQAIARFDEALAVADRIGPAFPAAERAHAAKAASLKALGRPEEARREVSEPPRVGASGSEREDVDALLAELDGLVGLRDVKRRIRSLVSFLRVQRLRSEAGMENVAISHHLAFTGSPGTGKTTVARLFGRLLHALEILGSDKLVEVSRADLVAGYVGQTAARVDEVIDSALDGVLFIDEAYSLSEGTGREDFGREAVTQLVKRMEDDRSRLAVIVAGYPEPMSTFLGSNPGLASRVAEVVPFADYSPEELFTIFEIFARRSDYSLSPSGGERLREHLAAVCAERDHRFGNARTARNLFEDAIVAQADRLVSEGATDPERLSTLEPADLDAALESYRRVQAASGSA